MNGSVDGLIVIAAVSVSYRNACAYGKADKEVDDKVCYRTGSTDCRDGNTAADMPVLLPLSPCPAIPAADVASSMSKSPLGHRLSARMTSAATHG